MPRSKRGVQEINAGSMADIAFLLLIFFLVTTTMDQDIGIMRQLPPPTPKDFTPPDVPKRDVYEVLVNKYNQLLVNNEPMDISQLKEGTIKFMTNPNDNPKLPAMEWMTRAKAIEGINAAKAALAQKPDDQKAKESLKDWEEKLNAVNLLGEYKVIDKSAIISLQNDRGTSYNTYIQVQNELQAGVDELRNNLSKEKFGVPYDQLDPNKDKDKDKIRAIREAIPMRISEATPVNTGSK